MPRRLDPGAARAPREEFGESERALALGYDLSRILFTDDLCGGDDVFFAATGVSDGDLLRGVRFEGGGRGRTQSIVMRAASGTVRTIETEHRWGQARAGRREVRTGGEGGGRFFSVRASREGAEGKGARRRRARRRGGGSGRGRGGGGGEARERGRQKRKNIEGARKLTPLLFLFLSLPHCTQAVTAPTATGVDEDDDDEGEEGAGQQQQREQGWRCTKRVFHVF